MAVCRCSRWFPYSGRPATGAGELGAGTAYLPLYTYTTAQPNNTTHTSSRGHRTPLVTTPTTIHLPTPCTGPQGGTTARKKAQFTIFESKKENLSLKKNCFQ